MRLHYSPCNTPSCAGTTAKASAQNPFSGFSRHRLIPDFAALHPGYWRIVPQFRNVRILRSLAERCESWQQCHNWRAPRIKQRPKKTLVKSTGWRAPHESFEFAASGQLKTHQACSPRGALARRSAGWSELRRLRAVSQTAPGRLRTLPLRHYGRCARSSL
jgi:hypothetical protein